MPIREQSQMAYRGEKKILPLQPTSWHSNIRYAANLQVFSRTHQHVVSCLWWVKYGYVGFFGDLLTSKIVDLRAQCLGSRWLDERISERILAWNSGHFLAWQKDEEENANVRGAYANFRSQFHRDLSLLRRLLACCGVNNKRTEHDDAHDVWVWVIFICVDSK